jgi:glycosyltransferase involved in cell wall biosynthesis
MTIGWIEISKKKYGGIVYNDEARKILSKNFDLDLLVCESKYFKKIKYLRIPESLFYLLRLNGEKDLWIRDFYSIVTLRPKKTKGKNLLIIHHLDFSGFPLIARPFLNSLKFFLFFRNLKKADAILTVSEYWKQYFLQKGYKNVYKIYNSFDQSNFNVSNEEVLNFKKKHGLQDKPIVYLGNCQKAKGVIESFNALKDLDVHFVTSGERKVKIPALNLNLNDRDYLILLKASSIVIAMSMFKEGWCRTAHESMLSKTPVIGSGLGGMRELLEDGRQIICTNFRGLKKEVQNLLEDSFLRKKIGEDGYNFAKNFTPEKFEQDWLNLIDNINS